MPQFNSGLTLFLSLMVEAIPFLLLGVLVSSLLLIFVDEQRLIALMPKNPFLGALAGSCLGFLFPVCECGNVPVARRLLMQGVSVPVAIGFLLAAPTINPVVIWATWTAFRDQPEIVVLRVVFSLAIATTVGWIFSVQPDFRPFLQPALARWVPESVMQPQSSMPTLLQSGTFLLGQPGQPVAFDAAAVSALNRPRKKSAIPWRDRLPLLLENMVQELRELGGVLVLGSLIAAALQVAVPRDWILSIGQGPVTSVVAMLVLGGVISICSTVDAFFALSFASTFTSGALLAFLVFGPMFDLKSMGLLLTLFRTRTLIYLVALVVQLTLILTLFVNLHVS
ncbi:MAG: permease [Thermosynechococcaceae cyanobacterium]